MLIQVPATDKQFILLARAGRQVIVPEKIQYTNIFSSFSLIYIISKLQQHLLSSINYDRAVQCF